jgi:F-type H+-transporting ATPase subunit b
MYLANIVLAFIHFILMFEGPGKTPEDTLLSVEPGLMIWTIIIFVILLYILKKLAWKPLLQSLNNREQMIKDSVDKAERMRQEAENMVEENKKLLQKADQESRQIINEGKQYADKVRSELLAKANQETSRMVEQAKADIEREKLDALNELKTEIANLAVKAAGKIIDENLDEKKQKKIIDNFMKQIPKN